MTTPTRAALANDLGERAQIIIGTLGYVFKTMRKGEPAIRIRPQSASNPEAVYIASNDALTMRDYDRFSRVFLNDFRGGFGQLAFDPTDAVSRKRFYDCNNLDIHEQGRVYLSPAIAATTGTLTTPANPVPLKSVSGFLYAGYASNVKYHLDWTAAATAAATSSAGDVVALEEDGTYVYGVVNGVGLNRWSINSAAAGTLFSNTVVANSSDRLLYANRLLYWSHGITLYSLSLTAAPPVTASALFNLTTGWTITDLTALTGGTIESPIIALANNGQRTGLWYWDGVNVHDYVMFPTGFVGLRVKQYLGVIFVEGYRINSNALKSGAVYYVLNGVVGFLGYLGTVQSNGTPTPSTNTINESYNIEAADNFVYFSIPSANEEVWKYDIVNGGLSRYMTVLTGTSVNFGGMAIYNNAIWTSFRSVTNTALYGPNMKFATTGTLDTSDLNLGQPWATNLWARIELAFPPLAAGEAIAVSYSTDSGATYTATDSSGATMSSSALGTKSATWLISNSTTTTASPYIRLRFTLTAGTSQATTPSLYAGGLKAVPQEPGGVVIEAWLTCADKMVMPNGQEDWQGASGSERIQNIQTLYTTQALTPVIYMAAGSTRAKNPTTISCLVDDYEIWENDTVGYHPGGERAIGIEGDIRVVLREFT